MKETLMAYLILLAENWDEYILGKKPDAITHGDAADYILTLLKEEIKKIENPYPDKRGFVAQREAFEECRNKVLKEMEK